MVHRCRNSPSYKGIYEANWTGFFNKLFLVVIISFTFSASDCCFLHPRICTCLWPELNFLHLTLLCPKVPESVNTVYSILQDHRRVLATDEWLRVKGCKGVYALGDCATIDQRKILVCETLTANFHRLLLNL